LTDRRETEEVEEGEENGTEDEAEAEDMEE